MARLSTSASSSSPGAVARAEPVLSPRRAWLSAAVELTKPRITKLVTITSGVGFLLSALLRSWGGPAWGMGGGGGLVLAAAGAVIGTSLSAAGAHALNEWLERDRDARMPRTAKRPLPAGKFSPLTAWLIGMGCAAAGVLVLWAACGLAPALVSLATILLYVLVYTPLKVVTPLSTIIGAVPGALPPLIGWSAAAAASGSGSSAASGLLEVGGWSLFLLMFVWQIPHFLAIAWMYKEDYARGGYRMLPLTDPDGRTTFATILIWATLLLPATVLPAMVAGRAVGVGGSDGFLWIYASVAVVSGVAFLGAAWRLAATQASPREEGDAAPSGQRADRAAAKRVFVWSIIHLPLLLVALVADALLNAW